MDDHMAVGIRKPGSCQSSVPVDSADPAARDWAHTVYRQYREKAIRMPQFSTPAYQEAMQTLSTKTA